MIVEARAYSSFLESLVKGLWNFGTGPFYLSMMDDSYVFDDEHKYWSAIKDFEMVAENYPEGGYGLIFGDIEPFPSGELVLSANDFRMRNLTIQCSKFVVHGMTRVPFSVDTLMFYYELDQPLVKDNQNVLVSFDSRGMLLFVYGE